MEGFGFNEIDNEKFTRGSIGHFINASLAGQRLDHACA